MICNTEELLLVVQNWITESATVVFSLVLIDESREPVLGVRLSGRIASLDRSLPGFLFVIGDEPAIVVNLQDWQFGYADGSAFPPDQNIAESFTINRPGASIAMWTTTG